MPGDVFFKVNGHRAVETKQCRTPLNVVPVKVKLPSNHGVTAQNAKPVPPKRSAVVSLVRAHSVMSQPPSVAVPPGAGAPWRLAMEIVVNRLQVIRLEYTS